jgi:hypothetical protein
MIQKLIILPFTFEGDLSVFLTPLVFFLGSAPFEVDLCEIDQ